MPRRKATVPDENSLNGNVTFLETEQNHICKKGLRAIEPVSMGTFK